MVRQITSNDDSGINELLSTSLTVLFPEDRKLGKLDEHTSSHTMESTDCELSEDESSECLGERIQTIASFELDETGNARVIDITDDGSEGSLRFGDVFPEYQPGIDDSFVDIKESFARIVGHIDVRNLRKEQRKKVIKAFFGPMKSLVRQRKNFNKTVTRIRNPIREITFRGNKRKLTRVTFAEDPVYIVNDNEQQSPSEECSEEIESTWYNEEEYDDMKKSVLKSMEDIVRCHKNKKEYVETDNQTDRGLELVTKEMIVERKIYKISSRHIVFDEQEDQRLARKCDPEKIRERYVQATMKARDTALEYGWKDQEAVQMMNQVSIRIDEENPVS